MSGGATEQDAVTALADAEPAPYWTSRQDAPVPGPPQDHDLEVDLVVIGGGFTGLWAAYRALERDPGRSVAIVDARHVAYGQSGRNGGFVAASLTHGLAHGLSLWPDELDALVAEGERNLSEIAATVGAEGIDCDLRMTGKSSIAIEPWQIAGLKEAAQRARDFGEDAVFQDADEIRADVASPAYLGAVRHTGGTALVDPARLAWGLADALRRRGVLVIEQTPVERIERAGAGVALRTSTGARIRARQAIVATAAYPSPLKRLSSYLMPVYDHVLMTEPLSAAQWSDVGWRDRQGLTDGGNSFHYYRPTADGRILWGGWDAVYYRGNRVDEALEQRESSHRLLARQFLDTFPQLRGTRFTHRWAGPIDSTTRFTAAYGTTHAGHVAYAVGHTGLGVGASRFSADVTLDLLTGQPTSRTRYGIVRRRPVPVPPEPLRNPIVQFTRRSMARADENEGGRNLWLRLLDRLGLGFNS